MKSAPSSRRRRRVPDREVLALMPEPLKLHDLGGRYRDAADTLIRDFRIAELFGLAPPAARVTVPEAPPVPERRATVTPDLVSVIVLTASGAQHLPDCLDSLRRQDWPRDRLEVIVVDNGSPRSDERRRAALAGRARGAYRPQPRLLRRQQRRRGRRLRTVAAVLERRHPGRPGRRVAPDGRRRPPQRRGGGRPDPGLERPPHRLRGRAGQLRGARLPAGWDQEARTFPPPSRRCSSRAARPRCSGAMCSRRLAPGTSRPSPTTRTSSSAGASGCSATRCGSHPTPSSTTGITARQGPRAGEAARLRAQCPAHGVHARRRTHAAAGARGLAAPRAE